MYQINKNFNPLLVEQCGFLGLGPTATIAECRRAYYRLMDTTDHAEKAILRDAATWLEGYHARDEELKGEK